MHILGRATLVAAALAIASTMAYAQPGHGGRGKGVDTGCDMKKVVKAYWCEKCDARLKKEDIDTKKRWHTKCETKYLKVMFCIKPVYKAACHPAKVSDKPVG